jgi:hypothetical protein
MPKPKPSIAYHKDGSIWNKGQTLDGEMHGYWEFYRKGGGPIMRSGSFDRGVKVGEWTTYDADGKVFKVTQMKPAAASAPAKKTVKAPAKAPKKSTTKAQPTAADFMASLDHPLKVDYEAVRKTILAADKSIADGVKWNSLSFCTTEWFATVNLRSRDTVQLVLHLGAKVGKETPADAIPDPKGLLKWLGKDRAIATLGAGPALKANLPTLKTLVKAWIRYV